MKKSKKLLHSQVYRRRSSDEHGLWKEIRTNWEEKQSGSVYLSCDNDGYFIDLNENSVSTNGLFLNFSLFMGIGITDFRLVLNEKDLDLITNAISDFKTKRESAA